MRNAELRQIRHVVTLGKHLSFTKAAKDLGITQSALTRSIQAIEEKGQVRLFDRDRGGVRATEVGKAYLAKASDLLREAEELNRMLHQTAAAETGEVAFGIEPVIARALMPQLLAKELVERPGLRSRVSVRSADSLLKLVLSEEIEFCICAERAEPPPSLRASIIGSLPLSLLVRPLHPLLAGWNGFEAGRFPLIVSGYIGRAERIPELVRRLVSWPPQIVIDDFGILAIIAANSDAIWLASTHAAADELRHGMLTELRLPDGKHLGHYRTVMYSHYRRSLSPAAKRIVDLMRMEMGRFKS